MYISTVPSGLVSYTIDEDMDDDEEEDIDDNVNDNLEQVISDGKLPNNSIEFIDSTLESESKQISGSRINHFLDSSVLYLNNPPTILSSEHYELSKQTVEFPTSVDLNVTKPEDNLIGLSERLIQEIQLPPEPTSHCKMELQEKVERAIRRMRLDIGYDLNMSIQDNKAFRNPRFVVNTQLMYFLIFLK